MVREKLRAYFASNGSRQERRLVRKIDIFILTFCCSAYFMNQLDHTNIRQAYVTGMKKDLNFKGSQLTVISSLYQLGYIIGIVPMNILLAKTKPRIFFPTMVTTWGCITMCNAAAQSPQHLMAIRFFQGVAESCIFSGTHFILGSWYTASELGKRTGIFTSSGLSGSMFSGFLQSGIYHSMNGLHGLPGWRWLFIIDGIITLPIAIYGFFLFPDTPATSKAPYLSADEIELAKQRVIPVVGKPVFRKEFLMRLLTSWHFYSFCLLWILTNCAEGTSLNGILPLYLQQSPNKKYTVYQLNNYPSGVMAAGITSTLFWATLTDIFGYRWMPGYYAAFTGIVGGSIVLKLRSNEAAQLGGYYWLGSILGCQGSFFAWANDTMRYEDASFRAVVIAAMNCGGNIFQVWWPLVFYAAAQAPEFTRGLIALIVVCALLAIWVSVILVVNNYKKKNVVHAASGDTESTSDYQVERGTMDAK